MQRNLALALTQARAAGGSYQHRLVPSKLPMILFNSGLRTCLGQAPAYNEASFIRSPRFKLTHTSEYRPEDNRPEITSEVNCGGSGSKRCDRFAADDVHQRQAVYG